MTQHNSTDRAAERIVAEAVVRQTHVEATANGPIESRPL